MIWAQTQAEPVLNYSTRILDRQAIEVSSRMRWAVRGTIDKKFEQFFISTW
jgi:hypothetical protein